MLKEWDTLLLEEGEEEQCLGLQQQDLQQGHQQADLQQQGHQQVDLLQQDLQLIIDL